MSGTEVLVGTPIAVSVNCGGFGVLVGFFVGIMEVTVVGGSNVFVEVRGGGFVGRRVLVGREVLVTMLVAVGTSVMVPVGGRVATAVEVGVDVLVLVGVNLNVRVGLGVEVGVLVDVGDEPMIPPPAVAVVKNTEREVGVEERVGVADPDMKNATTEVDDCVGVKLAARASPPLTGMISEEVVGVKKSSAKASCVNARSRGVAVAVCLGMRTMSAWVSGLPPAIRTGRLNARIHTPINTSTTMAPCALTELGLLFSTCCESSTTARSSMTRLHLPPTVHF